MTNLSDAISLYRKQSRQARRPRRTDEHDFQKVAIQHLNLLLPPESILTAIDHATKDQSSRIIRASIGVLPGLPDLHIGWSPDPAAHLSYVVWLECKARKGVLLREQQLFRDAALALGQFWFAPRTIEDVYAAIRSTPIPVRRIIL